jgi:hypothetical protein
MAGTFALIAALIWLVAAPICFVGVGSDDWEAGYVLLTVTAFAAAACTSVAILGLLRRADSGTARKAVVMILAGLATLLLGLAVWAWVISVALLTIAALVASLRLSRAGLANRLGSILLVVAWPVGIAVALALDAMEVGPVDSYGDAYVAQRIGFATGCVLFAAGLFVSGRLLRGEEVVNLAGQARLA